VTRVISSKKFEDQNNRILLRLDCLNRRRERNAIAIGRRQPDNRKGNGAAKRTQPMCAVGV
jgi:hypothetical protein